MAHEVELDAVDVEALEALADDAGDEGAVAGVGVVEAGADAVLDGALGEALPGAGDEAVRVAAAVVAVRRVAGVDDVVAVHSHPRKEGDAPFPAEAQEGGQGAAALLDEGAHVGGDLRVGVVIAGGVHEGVEVVEAFEGGLLLSEDLADLGLEVVDLVIAGRPPEGAAGAGVRGDDFVAQVGLGDGGVGVEDPGVVGEDDSWEVGFGHGSAFWGVSPRAGVAGGSGRASAAAYAGVGGESIAEGVPWGWRAPRWARVSGPSEMKEVMTPRRNAPRRRGLRRRRRPWRGGFVVSVGASYWGKRRHR